MEGAGKGKIMRVKKEDLGEKCIRFEENKDKYQKWMGRRRLRFLEERRE